MLWVLTTANNAALEGLFVEVFYREDDAGTVTFCIFSDVGSVSLDFSSMV